MIKGDVCYFDEIVEELSKEHNIPVDEMREICGSSLNYIKYLTSLKETLSIVLPRLGTMYFSTIIGKYFLRRHKKSKLDTYEDNIMDLEFRLEEIESQIPSKGTKKVKHKQRPFLYKFRNILKKLDKLETKKGASVATEEVWGKVSEIQNTINND